MISIGCAAFWISMASTVGWPTLLTVFAFIYMHVHVVYSYEYGGTVRFSTIGGLTIEEKIIPPNTNLGLDLSQGSLTGACCTATDSYEGGGLREANEAGFGSLALASTYPTRGFDWSTNNVDAMNAGCQLVRRMLKLPILAEEEVAWTKMFVSLVGFVLGIVGLARDPTAVPRSMRAIFAKGEVPDIRIFTLLVSIASLTGFLTGVVFGFGAYWQTSARSAVAYPTLFWKVVWIALSLVSFGVGCWQIDGKRKLKESVLGMFIYWVPVVTTVDLNLCGFSVFGLLGIVGAVLGIITGNEKAC